MRLPGRRSAWLAIAGQLAVVAAAHAQAPDWSLAARERLSGAVAVSVDLRSQTLADGERLLALGDATGARQAFERAALMRHAPDAEAALVRAQMQAGEYRQAISFAAHAAGAHRREWPAGMALYAWLLHAGGQGVAARRLLEESLSLAPDDADLLAAASQLARPWPRADGVLGLPPLRIAPQGWGAPVPASGRLIGSAVLVRGGTAALVPSALMAEAGTPGAGLWLRNGLGQTVGARAQARDDALGVVLLVLDTPMSTIEAVPVDREPFGGSPGFLVEYAPGDADASWPLLRQGFFARVPSEGPRALGIAAPPGPRSGPVFDAAGRLAGMAATAADGSDRLVPAGALMARFEALWTAPSGQAPARRRAEVDEIYERSLRLTLQVLRDR